MISANATSVRPGRWIASGKKPNSDPASIRRSTSADTVTTAAPTTAPVRLLVPPMTSIATTMKVASRKNSFGVTELRNWA